MQRLTLGKLVELLRNSRYADGTSVSFYLPFPTARDCPNGKGELKLWLLRENKVEWWAALVAGELAVEMHTGKRGRNMQLVRLGGEKKTLRLRGVAEDDEQYLDVERNLARGALGKKVKNYWGLDSSEGLKMCYKELLHLMELPERCLRLEKEHLRTMLLSSAQCKASQVSGLVVSGAQLTQDEELCEKYLQELLSDHEDSMWTNLWCGLLELERAFWGAVLEAADRKEQRLEVLAAVILLALNAGELVEEPEYGEQYDQSIRRLLMRRQAEKITPNRKKPQVQTPEEKKDPNIETAGADKEEEKIPESSANGLPTELEWQLLERRRKIAPDSPPPRKAEFVCQTEGKAPKAAALKETVPAPEPALPKQLREQLRQRMDSLKGRENGDLRSERR